MSLPDEQELRDRIRQLEERLARIETSLDLAPPEPPPVAPRTKSIPEWIRPVEPTEPTVETPVPPAHPPTHPPPAPVPPPVPVPPPPPAPAPDPHPTATPRRIPITSDRPAPRPTTPFELIVGGKWMAWVGAVAVVAAVAFFLKFAYDAGVWTKISEPIRALFGAVFGVALIGGGELALRRIGRPASVGLFGAGLSVLYVVAWAICARYGLVSEERSFILMALVAVAGYAITLRTRFLSIGVLSILGGYATPILLHEMAGHDLLRLVFLTMMLGIALGLSAARPAHFRSLRYVALAAQSIPAFVWLVSRGDDQWAMAVFFVTLWWSMMLAECTLAAGRRQTAVGNILATLLSTAAYVTTGTWILRAMKPAAEFDWLGSFTAATAILSAAVALHFGPGLEALRGQARTAMDKLAIALWAQAAALIAVAVALQFDGYGQSVAWLAIGVAAIEVSRRLPSRGVGIFGVIVGVLATGRIALVDWWPMFGLTSPARWTWGDVRITDWAILALIAVAATHVVAHRLSAPPRSGASRFRPWRVLPTIMAVAATIGWLAVTGVNCLDHALTCAWLLAPIALFATWRFGQRLRYFEIGIAVLVVTAGKWLLIDAILGRAHVGWRADDALPLLNAQMGLAVAIAAVAVWAYRIMQRRWREDLLPAGADGHSHSGINLPAQAILIVGSLFMLVAMSFECERFVDRLHAAGATWSLGHVRDLSLTLLWTLGGVGLGLVARSAVRRAPASSGAEGSARPGLVFGICWLLLGACGAKWILYDTLFWAGRLTADATGARLVVVNLQMAVGLVLATGALALLAAGRAVLPPAPGARARLIDHLAGAVPVAAAMIVLWGLSFEVDRAIGRFIDPTAPATWPPVLLRGLWWTLLWAAGGLAMHLVGRRRSMAPMVAAGWTLTALAAIAWLGLETFTWRIDHAPFAAFPVFNLQFAVGLAAAVLMAISTFQMRSRADEAWPFRTPPKTFIMTGLIIIGAIGLWLGTLEIDRASAGRPMARQPGFSAWWCLYSVVLIVLGFARRAPIARYAGLGLFAVATAKVFIVDLSQVELVWRWVSFLVLGLLLIATSVLYAKLAPRVLAGGEEEPPP